MIQEEISMPPINQNGFTLLEIIVAIAVLTIGLLSLYAMHVSAISSNTSANNITISSNWANDRIEILLNRPYDHSDLDDDNGNGTNQDNNNDGIDDSGGNSVNFIGGVVVGGNVIDNVGGNFGLNGGLIFDNTSGLLLGVNPALADGRAVSPDDRFEILWNVAVDIPVPNSKTIRVIVTTPDRGTTKAVSMTYIKSEKI